MKRMPSARRPWVAAALTDRSRIMAHARRARRDGADLLEVRADAFPKNELTPETLGGLLRALRRVSQRPLLLTMRSRSEGGRWPFSDETRLALYEAAMPWVDGVDVEAAAAIAGAVVRAAHRRGRWVVLSAHDFKKTPSAGALKTLAGRFAESGADIFKVAAMPRKASDVDRLMDFCAGSAGRRAFIAMGTLGRRTRLEPRRWGSCLTYGFVGKAAAPGQAPVKTLRRFLDARQKKGA